MLALKRRSGESITMELPDGRVIVVEVVELSHGVVRIGIEAPKDVHILRTELIGERT